MYIKLFVHGEPIAKGNHRIGHQGEYSYIYDVGGKKLKDWEKTIRECVKLEIRHTCQNFVVTDGAVRIDAFFCLPRPTDHFTKTGNHSIKWTNTHLKKPDRDKLLRAVQDALEGVVYIHDSQVVSGALCKKYSDIIGVFLRIKTLENEANNGTRESTD